MCYVVSIYHGIRISLYRFGTGVVVINFYDAVNN